MHSRFAVVLVLLATGFLLFLSRPGLAFDPDTDHTCVYNCGGDSGASYSSGGCNVICEGIRGLLGIATPSAPTGPSPAQIEAARRAQIEAAQQRELAEQRASEASFAAERDAAAAQLKGVNDDSGLKSGDAALHQLRNTDSTGTAAAHFNNEPAKDLSSCGFDDTRGCARAATVTAPKTSGPKPAGVSALWARLPPEAQKDPQIKQNVALLTKLEDRKTEKQEQLAALEKQIDQGGGDATVLGAKKGTLENALNQIDKDEQAATDQIGKRMADRHLSWNEGK